MEYNKRNGRKYDVDPIGIASIIFQEKYHGVFAEFKNWYARVIVDKDVENGPSTRSYGLAEMQLKLAGEFLGIDPEVDGVKTKMYNALMDEKQSIELIAWNIAKNEKELGYKLEGAEAGFLHNMGIDGYKRYLDSGTTKNNKPGDRVPKRSTKYQFAIKAALEGKVFFITCSDKMLHLD